MYPQEVFWGHYWTGWQTSNGWDLQMQMIGFFQFHCLSTEGIPIEVETESKDVQLFWLDSALQPMFEEICFSLHCKLYSNQHQLSCKSTNSQSYGKFSRISTWFFENEQTQKDKKHCSEQEHSQDCDTTMQRPDKNSLLGIWGPATHKEIRHSHQDNYFLHHISFQHEDKYSCCHDIWTYQCKHGWAGNYLILQFQGDNPIFHHKHTPKEYNNGEDTWTSYCIQRYHNFQDVPHSCKVWDGQICSAWRHTSQQIQNILDDQVCKEVCFCRHIACPSVSSFGASEFLHHHHLSSLKPDHSSDLWQSALHQNKLHFQHVFVWWDMKFCWQLGVFQTLYKIQFCFSRTKDHTSKLLLNCQIFYRIVNWLCHDKYSWLHLPCLCNHTVHHKGNGQKWLSEFDKKICSSLNWWLNCLLSREKTLLACQCFFLQSEPVSQCQKCRPWMHLCWIQRGLWQEIFSLCLLRNTFAENFLFDEKSYFSWNIDH